jgi:hypothetical protein
VRILAGFSWPGAVACRRLIPQTSAAHERPKPEYNDVDDIWARLRRAPLRLFGVGSRQLFADG